MSLGFRDETTRFSFLRLSGSGSRILIFCVESTITALTVMLEAPEFDEESAKADEADNSCGMIVDVEEDAMVPPLPEIGYEDTDENVDDGAANPWGEPMRPVLRAYVDSSFTCNPPPSSPSSVSAYSLSEIMVEEEILIVTIGLTACIGEDRYGSTGV